MGIGLYIEYPCKMSLHTHTHPPEEGKKKSLVYYIC